MATTNTTKNFDFDKAPAQIKLYGDKKKKVESSTHIIEFPGGAIELTRTTEGNYWAHIIVNNDFADEDCDGIHKAFGEIVGSRIDYEHPLDPIEAIVNAKQVRQVAILIRPVVCVKGGA